MKVGFQYKSRSFTFIQPLCPIYSYLLFESSDSTKYWMKLRTIALNFRISRMRLFSLPFMDSFIEFKACPQMRHLWYIVRFDERTNLILFFWCSLSKAIYLLPVVPIALHQFKIINHKNYIVTFKFDYPNYSPKKNLKSPIISIEMRINENLCEQSDICQPMQHGNKNVRPQN